MLGVIRLLVADLRRGAHLGSRRDLGRALGILGGTVILAVTAAIILAIVLPIVLAELATLPVAVAILPVAILPVAILPVAIAITVLAFPALAFSTLALLRIIAALGLVVATIAVFAAILLAIGSIAALAIALRLRLVPGIVVHAGLRRTAAVESSRQALAHILHVDVGHRNLAAADAPNRLDGVVSEVNFLGGTTSYRVRLDSGAVVRASMANTARAAEAYGEGQRVTAWFAAEDCVVLEQ